MSALKKYLFNGKIYYKLQDPFDDFNSIVWEVGTSRRWTGNERFLTPFVYHEAKWEKVIIIEEVLSAVSYAVTSDSKVVKWKIEGWAEGYEPKPPQAHCESCSCRSSK